MFEEYEFAPSLTIGMPFDPKKDYLTSESNSSQAITENISTISITEVDKDLIVDVTQLEENVAQREQLCYSYSATRSVTVNLETGGRSPSFEESDFKHNSLIVIVCYHLK